MVRFSTFATVTGRNGHTEAVATCPLFGDERTSLQLVLRSEFDPIRTLAVGRGAIKWTVLSACDVCISVSSREPDVASLNDQELRRIGSQSDGSAGETLSEPYLLCLTCCRCVDGLGLLRGARSGGSGACSTGTGSARHPRGTKGNRAVLVPV